MPPIYINTDNSDKNNKVYNANMVGPLSADVESKMQAMVVKAFEKASEFTTNKVDKPKGYTLYFKVTKFKSEGRNASCTISGEILRFPNVTYSKDKRADASQVETVMTGTNWSNSASAMGRTAVMDCVEAIMETMVPRSFPVMKADMGRR